MTYDLPVDSSTSLSEKLILQALILAFHSKNIVEIGTHWGLTTLYLAEAALQVGGHVTTYDPYDYGQAATFDKYPNLPITFHLAKAIESQDTDIDFLFVDGFHEKHLVLEELEHFMPRLAPGALVVFHDTKERNPSCDVPGALEEWGLPVYNLDTENGLVIYRLH